MIVAEPPPVRRPAPPTALGLSIVAAIILAIIAVPIYLRTTREPTVEPAVVEETTDVYFNPDDQTTTAVVDELGAANLPPL